MAQSYTYSAPAGSLAALTQLGLQSMARPADPAAPNGQQLIGPMTPGGLANKAIDTAPAAITVRLSQIDGYVLIEDLDASVQLTPQVIPAFGAA